MSGKKNSKKKQAPKKVAKPKQNVEQQEQQQPEIEKLTVEQVDGMTSEQCCQMMNDANKRIAYLEHQLASHEEGSLSEFIHEGNDCCGDVLSPQEVTAGVALIRDRINDYPMEEEEFRRLAPQFARQAVILAREVRQAIADDAENQIALAEQAEQDALNADIPTENILP